MKRKTKIILSITIIIAVSFLFIKPISVKYHILMADRWWDEVKTYNPDKSRQSNVINLLKAEKHRDALVQLKYYKRKVIPLKHIEFPSRESKALWNELQQAFLTEFSTMEGYSPGDTDQIILYDLPENISKLEQIVAAHDKASATTNSEQLSK